MGATRRAARPAGTNALWPRPKRDEAAMYKDPAICGCGWKLVLSAWTMRPKPTASRQIQIRKSVTSDMGANTPSIASRLLVLLARSPMERHARQLGRITDR